MTDLREALIKALTLDTDSTGNDSFVAGQTVLVVDDLILPVIAAHEAEAVGGVLDRIDALHPKVAVYLLADECPCALDGDHDTHESEQGDLICLDSPTGDHICGDCHHSDGEPMDWPCPTRRLTAEIRGELSHG